MINSLPWTPEHVRGLLDDVTRVTEVVTRVFLLNILAALTTCNQNCAHRGIYLGGDNLDMVGLFLGGHGTRKAYLRLGTGQYAGIIRDPTLSRWHGNEACGHASFAPPVSQPPCLLHWRDLRLWNIREGKHAQKMKSGKHTVKQLKGGFCLIDQTKQYMKERSPAGWLS